MTPREWDDVSADAELATRVVIVAERTIDLSARLEQLVDRRSLLPKQPTDLLLSQGLALAASLQKVLTFIANSGLRTDFPPEPLGVAERLLAAAGEIVAKLEALEVKP